VQKRAGARKEEAFSEEMVEANTVFKVDMVGFAFASTLVRKPFVE
jgi:hypothetical protein